MTTPLLWPAMKPGRFGPTPDVQLALVPEPDACGTSDLFGEERA